ncbi:hypothetical protein DFJ73DRAFT_947982 [Zopfochytrium polystomum]|nr:hypothetical protein DFJ73DRAFT_947982 [Zopfochytrium polystomum]
MAIKAKPDATITLLSASSLTAFARMFLGTSTLITIRLPDSVRRDLDPLHSYADRPPPPAADADLERAFLLARPDLCARALATARRGGHIDNPDSPDSAAAADDDDDDDAAAPLVFLDTAAAVPRKTAFAAGAAAPLLAPSYTVLPSPSLPSSGNSGGVAVARVSLTPTAVLELVAPGDGGAPVPAAYTLIRGANGSASGWAIAGSVRVRNAAGGGGRQQKAVRVTEVRVELAVEYAGLQVVDAGRKTAAFRHRLFDAPPVVVVVPGEVSANTTFEASFHFPFPTAGPPALDLTTSMCHPTAAVVRYVLTATTTIAAPGTSPTALFSKPQTFAVSYKVPVGPPAGVSPPPPPPPTLRCSSGPDVAGSGGALGWWMRLPSARVFPGSELIVEVAVSSGGGGGVGVKQAEVTLSEVVAHVETGADGRAVGAAAAAGATRTSVGPGGAVRATAHVARRVTVLGKGLEWEDADSDGGGVWAVAAAAAVGDGEASAGRVRILRVKVPVPPHPCTTRPGPAVAGMPAEPARAGTAPAKLPRVGKMVSTCVHFDGQWNGVLVAHELTVRLTVERGRFVDWVEETVPVVVVAPPWTGGDDDDAEELPGY